MKASSAAGEDAYRRHYLHGDAVRLLWLVVGVQAFNLVSSRNDFVFSEGAWLWAALGVRALYLLLGVASVLVLRRITSPRSLDRVLVVNVGAGLGLAIVVGMHRPPEFLSYHASCIATVSIIYYFLTGPLFPRAVLAVAWSTASIVVVSQGASWLQTQSALLGLLIFNGVGVLAARQADRQRRDWFAAFIELRRTQSQLLGRTEALRQAQESLSRANAELEERIALRTAELRQSNQALVLANADLEQLARAKDEFLAAMSHELRTPLGAMLGVNEALAMEVYGPVTEKQRAMMRIVEANGRELLALIEDVLCWASIQSGSLRPLAVPLVLGELAEEVAANVRRDAVAKRIDLRVAIDAGALGISSDATLLRQVLLHLLGNAIKFTPAGGSVRLSVTKAAAGVELRVTDTGVGIEAADLDRIFDPFLQLDGRLSRGHGGSGLGLALARKKIELLGGKLEVESLPGRGSSFWFQLPLGEGVSNSTVAAAGAEEANEDGLAFARASGE